MIAGTGSARVLDDFPLSHGPVRSTAQRKVQVVLVSLESEFSYHNQVNFGLGWTDVSGEAPGLC